MKQTLSHLAVLALTIFATGCASEFENRKEAALAAGFKVITPRTPDQVALLPMLPKKMSLLNYRGQPVYVLPDVEHNRAYVGRLAQYEDYQQRRIAQHLDKGDHEAAEAPQLAALNFGGWDGANVLGPSGLR